MLTPMIDGIMTVLAAMLLVSSGSVTDVYEVAVPPEGAGATYIETVEQAPATPDGCTIITIGHEPNLHIEDYGVITDGTIQSGFVGPYLNLRFSADGSHDSLADDRFSVLIEADDLFVTVCYPDGFLLENNPDDGNNPDGDFVPNPDDGGNNPADGEPGNNPDGDFVPNPDDGNNPADGEPGNNPDG